MLAVDDLGVVVGCAMFLTTLNGYLITQLRVHMLTFIVSAQSSTTWHDATRHSRSLPHPHYPPPHHTVCCPSLLPLQFLCMSPVLLFFQLFYCGYCLFHLRLGLFGHHAYAFLHLVSCVVLLICEVTAWGLYRQEERSEEWAREEEELDEVIVKTTMSEYLRLAHRAEHQDSNSCFV